MWAERKVDKRSKKTLGFESASEAFTVGYHFSEPQQYTISTLLDLKSRSERLQKSFH
jgi:hypothetical protein